MSLIIYVKLLTTYITTGYMLNFRKKNDSFEKLSATLRERLTVATSTLERISEGKFDIHVPVKANDEDGDDFLKLLNSVKAKLSDYADKEAERKWIADGTSEFISLTAGDNRERKDFHDRILKFIINYTSANQGGLFLINDNDPDDPFLEMISCYAYGKKKYEVKRVNIGEGILGQCYLEKQTVRLSEVPQNYTKITSGLGEATPRFLLIIPIQYNSVVHGVIELAYFKKCESYKIEFLEKIAENIASVTMNYRNAKKAEALFEESQGKARLLQEKEESLRQNVEELMATQEEMKRNELELDRQAQLLKFIVDNIPFPIFVKDEKGRYTLVNKAESNLFGIPDKELLGKDDSAFVSKAEEWDVIQKSDQKVFEDNLPVELPLQNFTTQQGKSYIFKTTKIPFLNQVTGKKNILGVSVDLTEKLALESQLLFEKTQNQWNTFVNLTGRQRMLSQKIAFYCETLCRGRKHNHAFLRDAIELYEHSHQVIRNGGMPMRIRTDHPLPPLKDELIHEIKRVETVWIKFKKAAENILYFSTLESGTNLSHTETAESLQFIEENAEILLELNNQFMLQYMEANKQKNILSY